MRRLIKGDDMSEDFSWLKDAQDTLNEKKLKSEDRLAAFTWEDGTHIFPCRQMTREEYMKQFDHV